MRPGEGDPYLKMIVVIGIAIVLLAFYARLVIDDLRSEPSKTATPIPLTITVRTSPASP